MTYIGDEPEWQTIKYRCPAKHEGCHCPMNALSNEGRSCGKTVHVPGEMDLRRFPAILRLTKTFERLYKGRTAVQRVNARLKVFYFGAMGGRTIHFVTVDRDNARFKSASIGAMNDPIAEPLHDAIGQRARSS